MVDFFGVIIIYHCEVKGTQDIVIQIHLKVFIATRWDVSNKILANVHKKSLKLFTIDFWSLIICPSFMIALIPFSLFLVSQIISFMVAHVFLILVFLKTFIVVDNFGLTNSFL